MAQRFSSGLGKVVPTNQWQLAPLENGTYAIVNLQSGKVLDVTGGSAENGAVVQQWTWLGGSNQQWQIIPVVDSGDFELRNVQSGKALDVRGGTTSDSLQDGAAIQQWDYNGSANQVWQLVPVTNQSAGQTPDGSVVGISVISIANGSVSTYSATELDYTASAYYDAYTEAYLYSDGVQIQSASSQSNGIANGGFFVSSTDYTQYDLRTDHYAVAFLFYGGYYQNPLGYQYTSSGDSSGDTVFYPQGGAIYVVAAYIYLGSTTIVNIAAPGPEGNVPYNDESAIVAAERPPKSNSRISIDQAKEISRRWSVALAAALSANWAKRGNGQYSNYVFPRFLIVRGDCDTAASGGNYTTRTRTYLIMNSNGTTWKNYDPLIIRENVIATGELSIDAAGGMWGTPGTGISELIRQGIFEDDLATPKGRFGRFNSFMGSAGAAFHS